jgi:hypothetical protein
LISSRSTSLTVEAAGAPTSVTTVELFVVPGVVPPRYEELVASDQLATKDG